MTALLRQAIRHVERLPREVQDRAAHLLLHLQEAEPATSAQGSLESLLDEPSPHARTDAEIDADLAALREEWRS